MIQKGNKRRNPALWLSSPCSVLFCPTARIQIRATAVYPYCLYNAREGQSPPSKAALSDRPPQILEFSCGTSFFRKNQRRTATRFAKARSALKYFTLIGRQLHHPYTVKVPYSINFPKSVTALPLGATRISHLRTTYTKQEFSTYAIKLRHAN